jgi:hypothetical protein
MNGKRKREREIEKENKECEMFLNKIISIDILKLIFLKKIKKNNYFL